jgi:hypothetical protein
MEGSQPAVDYLFMTWKSIRLELAKSDNFPRGAPSRVDLFRLPLNADGSIDEDAVRDLPGEATVRRFWPSEPDLAGYVVPAQRGWDLAYDPFQPGAGRGRLESDALRLGDCVTLTEPDGARLPFTVASLDPLR